mgnify:FL=1
MNEIIKRGSAYFLSLCIVTAIYVYILNIPEFISQAPALVTEYYYDRALESFVLDIFLVAAYITVAMYAGKLLNINQKDNVQQLIMLCLTTIAISGSFMLYFNSGGSPGTFFSRWFKQVGYKAIVYDMVLICSVYMLMVVIYKSNIFERIMRSV